MAPVSTEKAPAGAKKPKRSTQPKKAGTGQVKKAAPAKKVVPAKKPAPVKKAAPAKKVAPAKKLALPKKAQDKSKKSKDNPKKKSVKSRDADQKAKKSQKSKKDKVEKFVNPLFAKRPKNYNIGCSVQKKRDLSHYVRFPKDIRLRRRLALLKRTIKCPPIINQFTGALNSQKAYAIFKFLDRFRPPPAYKLRKKYRSKARVIARGGSHMPFHKDLWLIHGLKTITHLVMQKKARMVLIASDVDPVELVLWLPLLCRKMGVPHAFVKNKGRLGQLVRRKNTIAVALPKARMAQASHQSLKHILRIVRENYMGDDARKARGSYGGKRHITKEQLIKMTEAKELKAVRKAERRRKEQLAMEKRIRDAREKELAQAEMKKKRLAEKAADAVAAAEAEADIAARLAGLGGKKPEPTDETGDWALDETKAK